VEALACDLAPVIARLRPGDHLLIATASEIDCLGLSRAIAATAAPAGIGWHLQFHAPLLPGPLPPVDGPSPLLQDSRLARVRRCLADAMALASPHRLRFHCPTDELAAEWELAGADGAGTLPYCIEGMPVPRPGAGEQRLRVASLGDARAEKNSRAVAMLVEAVAADHALRDRVRFAFQSNTGFDAGSRRSADIAIRRAIDSLRARTDDLVECIAGPLDAAAYRGQIDAADALLLPYDQLRYRQRCSAILLEALAAGRPPIVTAGGWMARQLLAAHREHANELAARHRIASDPDWLPSPVAADGSLAVSLTIPADADALLLEARWRGGGREALLGPAARVGLSVAGIQRGAILQADPTGAACAAVLRLAAGGGHGATGRTTLLTVASTAPRVPVGLSEIRWKWIRSGPSMPLGAAGVIVPEIADLEEGLREFVDHAWHYRRTAALLAPAIVATHSPDAVLDRLLA
jgi:hypothetical protein